MPKCVRSANMGWLGSGRVLRMEEWWLKRNPAERHQQQQQQRQQQHHQQQQQQQQQHHHRLHHLDVIAIQIKRYTLILNPYENAIGVFHPNLN